VAAVNFFFLGQVGGKRRKQEKQGAGKE